MPAHPLLADSALLLDSVPPEAPEAHRIAAVILAEVGCESVEDFRRMLSTADKVRTAASLAPVSSSTAGGFQHGQEAEEAVTGLADLVKTQGQAEAGHRSIFSALQGFLMPPWTVQAAWGDGIARHEDGIIRALGTYESGRLQSD